MANADVSDAIAKLRLAAGLHPEDAPIKANLTADALIRWIGDAHRASRGLLNSLSAAHAEIDRLRGLVLEACDSASESGRCVDRPRVEYPRTIDEIRKELTR